MLMGDVTFNPAFIAVWDLQGKLTFSSLPLFSERNLSERHVFTNEKVLKKVANSFVVKIAAQITAYFLHRGKEVGRKKIKHMTKSIVQKDTDSSTSKSGKTPAKSEQIFKNFSEAFKEQWKQEEIKRQQKKLAKKAKKQKEGKE